MARLALPGELGVSRAPGATAALVPLGFLGLPSLDSIIEAIAKGFFGALASALVPDWLRHGTVATIQHLVALPDPARWSHVGQLQEEMVYLGAMLLPLTLAVSTLRFWLLGFTGGAHPVAAIGRCGWVTAVLVAYRWLVEQAVAATNTLTHAILGLPSVAGGLQRIIGVLFGGALLTGTGGVFGAFLVIIGVVFAAGLFACQVLLTVVLAFLFVAGPPLIALSAIPELSHLARTWAHALLATALVPLGWTVLFATAGALCLDATSFTGGAGGLPGRVAAALAGLITFVIVVRLPLMLLGEVRHLFGAGRRAAGAGEAGSAKPAMPGAERVRAAHARLRSVALEGIPSLGRSAGRAAGALGAPAGGPAGAARRGVSRAARGSRILAGGAGGLAVGAAATGAARRGQVDGGRRGVRERVALAGAILAGGPRGARAAIARNSGEPGVTRRRPPRGSQSGGSATATARGAVSVVSAAAGTRPSRAGARRAPGSQRASLTSTPPDTQAAKGSASRGAGAGEGRAPTPSSSSSDAAYPGRKLATSAQREASQPAAARGTPAPKQPLQPPKSPPARDRKRPRRRPRPRRPPPRSTS